MFILIEEMLHYISILLIIKKLSTQIGINYLNGLGQKRQEARHSKE